MKELFMKDGNSIFTFKKGDVITRMKPGCRTETRTNDNLGITTEVEVGYDYSYLGEPLELIGIYNNCIWYKYAGGSNKRIFGDKPGQLRLTDWSEGWALYEMPEGYTLDMI